MNQEAKLSAKRGATWHLGGLAVTFLAGMALPGALHASAVTFLDHFLITRSLTPVPPAQGAIGVYEGAGVFYGDLFSNGVAPPSAGQFFGPSPATYIVQFGSFGAADEAGGKLRLDSSKGGFTMNSAGNARVTQQVLLPTNADPTNSVAGLKQAFHTFSIYGRFDLTLPPNPIDSYQIFLRDSGPGLFPTEELAIGLRRALDDTLQIIFFQQDFAGGTLTIFDADPLVFPAGADQVELRLERTNLDNDLVSGAYRFLDNGAPVTAFTVMDDATDFFNSRAWGQPGFRAVQAFVPEPGTFVLVLGALSGLIVCTRRRTR